MIPEKLTHKHFNQAANQIDDKSVPNSRKSVHYDLLLNGNKYPPKYIISLAVKFATGTEYSSTKFNAVESKNYFIKRGYTIIDRRYEAEKAVVGEDDESSSPEGKVKFTQHRKLERDGNISKKAKIKRLQETGCLKCDVCGFDFRNTYGDIGTGFIEAHHKKPLSQLKGQEKTKVSDLALVCSNCHRMLHRADPPISIEELKEELSIDII